MARRQATIWANTRVLSIGILRTNLSENLSEIHICFIKEKRLWKCRLQYDSLFFLGLNVSTRKHDAMCQNRAGTSPTLRASGWSRINSSPCRAYWGTFMQTHILHPLITDTPYLALTGQGMGRMLWETRRTFVAPSRHRNNTCIYKICNPISINHTWLKAIMCSFFFVHREVIDNKSALPH